MAITTTEIKVGTVELDKVDRVIEFFQTHGFMVKEYQGYECFLLGKHTVERVCSGLSPLRRDRLWC